MNKEMYLNELKKALSGLNEQEKEAALAFCTEMIDDRVEAGLTEEAAVNAMDAPAQMAEKLAVDFKQPPQAAASFAPPQSNEWQKMVLRCAPEGINHINLQTTNMGIKAIPSKDGQITLTYFTRAQNIHEATVEGDTLILREIKSVSSRNFFSFFSGPGCREGVTLELPADMMVNLKMQSKNGGLSLSDMQMLMHVDMHTTNGGLSVSRVNCISLDIKTTNGGLALSETKAKTFFDAGTTNGGLAVKDCFCPLDLSLHTTNGGVAVANCVSQKHLSIRSSNGGMKVHNLNGASLALHTSNAPITGTLPGPQSLWQIESHTTNGRNNLPASQPGEKPLSVHTSNGSIHIIFE